ncbi:RHS repeat-associated core domain-containing protein [Nonomuraea sp. NPDC050451]|uniref:golvesin C-terminal-like domain-containing protein n=1 Tax=Nonomuraea sp. NPDC050451 TaxID=3364364 RepID=UPI0037BA2BD1
MIRLSRLLASFLVFVLLVAFIPEASAASPHITGGWIPESERTLWDRATAWFTGDGLPEPRVVPVRAVESGREGAALGPESPPGTTYYAPGTPARVPPDSTLSIPVTLTNTTTATWAVADWVLSYRWSRPDGTPVTVQQLHTALPGDLAPDAAVTVQAQLRTPPASAEGDQRTGYVLAWDLWNKSGGAWLSTANTSKATALTQTLSVEDATSDQLGLEKFYSYGGVNTGAGSTLLTNLYSGNAVWQYNAFSNPSRGLSTFVRLAYNSKDSSDAVAGHGWSLQATSLTRLGTTLDPHLLGHAVSFTDGDGTTHSFALDDKGTWDTSDDEYVNPPGVHLYLQRLKDCKPWEEEPRAWVMTSPDRTRFFFDCQGYQSSITDNNGNELTFGYEVRKTLLGPVKYLRHLTDPTGRRTLTIDYYATGDPYDYIDDDTWERKSGTKLLNPLIIDHVKTVKDISGRTLTFTYTHKGLLGELIDGAGSAQPKKFRFAYDGHDLTKVTDPRGKATRLAYRSRLDAFLGAAETITDRLGQPTSFAYGDSHDHTGRQVRTVVTDAEQRATTYLLDGKGRALQSTDAKARTTKLTWDADNNVTRLEEANGAASTWSYDPKTGYPREIRDAEATKNGWPGTTLTYQTGLNGHIADLIAKRSPEGRAWTFTYTPEGDLATATDPAGTATPAAGDYTTTYTYDTWGQPLTSKDANGHTVTNAGFDPSGYPREIVDPLGKTTAYVYDERGNVTKVVDANGKATSQEYDVFARPLEKRVPKDQTAGQFVVTPAPEYDPNDNATRVTAPNGAVATAAYDAADQLSHLLEPKDEPGGPERKTSYTYDRVGNVRTVTEPKGNLTATAGDFTTTYGYDEIYQLISIANAKGHRLTYAYDAVGNVTAVTDARKNATPDPADVTASYVYDLAHRAVRSTDAAGKARSTVFDRDGLVKATTDEDGNTTTVTLDARGLPVEATAPYKRDGGTVVQRTMRFEYDQVGNRTKVITPRGVESADDPDDFVHQVVYDELNRVKEEIAPYDKDDPRYNRPDRTIRTYDAVGNLTRISAPPSSGESVRNDTVYTHYDNGWIKTSGDPWDIVASYDYNPLGQQIKNTLTSAGGSVSRTMTTDYFPDGKLRSRTDDGVPVGAHTVVVDNSDVNNARPSGEWTAHDAGEGLYGHDFHTKPAGDGTAQFQWALNIPQAGSYEVFVRWPAVQGAATDAEFLIDHKAGTAVKTVDQSAGPGTWVSLGRHDFDAGVTHKITLTDKAAAGSTVVADAVKLVRDNSGDPDDESRRFAYHYDADANLTSITDSSAGARIDDYAITYDELDQVAKLEERLDGATKNTISFTYDENGQPVTQQHDKEYSTFEYDVRDLPSKITHGSSAADLAPMVTTFAYTARGQRLHEVKGNGNTVDYEYNLDGSLLRQTEKKPGGTVVSEHTLDYDANGQRSRDVTRKMNADDHSAYLTTTADYAYDPRDRIAKLVRTGHNAGTETYVHDANNNVVDQVVGGTRTTFDYDRNRLAKAVTGGTAASYDYDPFGRLAAVVSGGQVVERNTYDGFDHVVENRRLTAPGSTTTTRFAYDPLDRTASKTTDAGGAGEKSTVFNYLALSDEVLDEETAGKITKSYRHSPWGERLAQATHDENGARQESYFGYNPHGDVETLTDAAGDTRATYGYSAYGKGEDAETTGIDKPDPQDPTKEPYNPYRFNAQRWDATSGRYDMGFRDYDPGLNRFLSRDMYNGALDDLALEVDPWTSNRYAFAAGNPVNLIELDGHDPHGCRPTDDAASRACHDRGRAAFYADQPKQVVPTTGPTEKINDPELAYPPEGMRPEDIDAAGIILYGGALSELAGFLNQNENKRGDFTVVLSRVTVDTGHGTVSRVIAFVSQGGLPKGLQDKLTNMGVTIYQAPKVPKGGDPRDGHAERAAADVRGDVNRQVRDLGGKIINVHSAFSSVRVCSAKCEGNLNRFIDDPSKKVRAGTNGMIEGTQLTPQTVGRLRDIVGRGAATWVAARAYWGGFLRGPGGRGRR